MGEGLLADAGLRLGSSGAFALGGVPLEDVAARVGTPVYVYNAEAIRERYRSLAAALASLEHRICYAVKANGNLSVLRVLRDLGAGADIVSGGELDRVLAAGFVPEHIVFSGVGKSTEELGAAVRAGVGLINLESLEELDHLALIAAAARSPVAVGLRVNPDVTTETHPYIATGGGGIKFGIPVDQVPEAARRIGLSPHLVLRCLAMHLGSQLLDPAPFAEGLRRLLRLIHDLGPAAPALSVIDVGGGLGIRYQDEAPLDPSTYAATLIPLLQSTPYRLHVEPGRFLVGSAGILLTRVLYTKHSGGKDFVIVDAAMNDLLRPSHYQAYHEVVEVTPRGRRVQVVDLVGPVCETGDFLALDRAMPGVRPGELLAILGVGAYGFVMASQYNARPRPPEVLVDKGRFALARRRETASDLMQGETPTPLTHEAT